MRISELCDHACSLGEGPLWDSDREALYWVDSFGPTLLRHGFSDGRTHRWQLPGNTVGSLAVRSEGGLLLAMDQGIYAFDSDSGDIESIAQPLLGNEDLRLNDGKVDPFGYFVTGAMNIDYRQKRNCAMYRLSPGLELEQILDGFSCFNGPCFSADGEQLFVTGRDELAIEVFDYGRAQKPCNGRVFYGNCNPDGATVDAEGCVWSAQWDDACIIRIAPDGSLDRRIDFPGQVVSSVMFGGPRLDLIYVTTTSTEVHGVSPSAQRPGRVLVVTGAGYRGRAETRFAG